MVFEFATGKEIAYARIVFSLPNMQAYVCVCVWVVNNHSFAKKKGEKNVFIAFRLNESRFYGAFSVLDHFCSVDDPFIQFPFVWEINETRNK